MDDTDAELQDRIDKRTAGIILRAARALRSTSLLWTITYLRSSKGVRDRGGLKEFCIWDIAIRRSGVMVHKRYIIGKYNVSTRGNHLFW
jgi:hypothetical protein